MDEYQSAIAGFIAFPVVKWLLLAIWNQLSPLDFHDDKDESI